MAADAPPGDDAGSEGAALTRDDLVDGSDVSELLGAAAGAGETLSALVDERTVSVDESVDEDEFFSMPDGRTTIVNRYDLEKAVSMEKKRYFREVTRYWVDKPYAFVVIFHSEKENERKYYLVEPHLNSTERNLVEFLTGKLRTAITYSSDRFIVKGGGEERAAIIREETERLLDRYDLYRGTFVDSESALFGRVKGLFGMTAEPTVEGENIQGIAARPEPAVIEEDATSLTEYQVAKIHRQLLRDFVGYERIDGIKHDVNVEDISCDGYNSPVFVYHSDHEQLITNVSHGEQELDDFVVKLAQRSNKGISKRQPQVDATLADGSRAQLTLGREVSGHGTNYTIRQFKDVPYTPVDLINWHTFSLDMMAFLWLCIENDRSVLFAGGTASGKTTSLNAMSLFIPSTAKIVSIEDTRELEIPQRNWVASVTRPSFSHDGAGDIDDYDLLEAALRQRPEHLIMGEVRGEEGRTLFQVMSTGHTSHTTFHADNVGEVIKRFTTDPINVSKTLFTALDLISVQTATRIHGRKVRRSKVLTEVNYYNSEQDEINVQDVFQWQASTDEFLQRGRSNTLEDIMFDRGWDEERLQGELFLRRLVLAYLIDRGFNTYTEVAATLQAFINDHETVLTLIANDELEESFDSLREMESVMIDTASEKEAMVPRPEPDDRLRELVAAVLAEGEEVLATFRGKTAPGLAAALPQVDRTPPATGAEMRAEADGGDGIDESPDPAPTSHGVRGSE
ncbi:type II/IV secretion system ATPase subunit [Halomarina rubra]|uniref:Type II/IV secretion system ATPase subunit n=1 Tax=Halomarina rubra TaxID=2071873 RepID=A0ABD6AQ87_9EURY|nr:type II/IV secretion system ATPase subunit [Halomarina rubra]